MPFMMSAISDAFQLRSRLFMNSSRNLWLNRRNPHQCLETKILQGENLKMTTEQVITQDPDIHGGLPVKSLIDHLKAGDSLDHFLEGFPFVSRQQAIAFLEIALTTVTIGNPPSGLDELG